MRTVRSRICGNMLGNRLTLMLPIMLFCMFFIVSPDHPRAKIANRIVAIVNSDIITLHELNTSIKRLTGLSAKELRLRGETSFYEVRRAVLDSLINEKITKQQIIKSGIKGAEKDVDEAIEKVKRENNLTQEELLYSLKQEGITLTEYREKMEREIQRFQLVNHEVKSRIVITEEEMRNYYQEHAREYAETHEVRLARIFLKVRNPDDREETAQVRNLGIEILEWLKEGRDFSKMARIHSQGPAASEGGDLGWVKVSELAPRLREKVAKLSAGEHTDLDLAPSGFQIIKLIEEKRGEIKPFEKVRDVIYSRLFGEKVEKRYATWLKRLRDESFIKVIF